MEYRYVLMESGPRPEIFKVQLNMMARLINQYPDRKVAVFETLKDATMAGLASIELAESRSRSGFKPYGTEPSPEIVALRRRFSDLTEDRVETFIP
jgi:hypothetical protein